MTGADVIDDICENIRQSLSRDCHLRQTDSYARYTAKATVELQLEDIDSHAVSFDVAIGTIKPEQPSKQITLSLVRPVDPAGAVEVPARERRMYVSRIRRAE